MSCPYSFGRLRSRAAEGFRPSTLLRPAPLSFVSALFTIDGSAATVMSNTTSPVPSPGGRLRSAEAARHWPWSWRRQHPIQQDRACGRNHNHRRAHALGIRRLIQHISVKFPDGERNLNVATAYREGSAKHQSAELQALFVLLAEANKDEGRRESTEEPDDFGGETTTSLRPA
jgi:hypothetical protein